MNCRRKERIMLEILAQSLLLAVGARTSRANGGIGSHEMRQEMILHDRRLREAEWRMGVARHDL
jgi:hypothetical protein